MLGPKQCPLRGLQANTHYTHEQKMNSNQFFFNSTDKLWSNHSLAARKKSSSWDQKSAAASRPPRCTNKEMRHHLVLFLFVVNVAKASGTKHRGWPQRDKNKKLITEQSPNKQPQSLTGGWFMCVSENREHQVSKSSVVSLSVKYKLQQHNNRNRHSWVWFIIRTKHPWSIHQTLNLFEIFLCGKVTFSSWK